MALSVIKDPKVRLRQHTFWVRSVHWSPDGQLLATGSADKNLRAFDLEGNEVYKVPHPDWVWHAIFYNTPKRKRIATACLDGNIRIMEAEDGHPVTTIKAHSSTINCISASSDGRLIASGSYDKLAKIFDGASGKEYLKMESSRSPVLCVCFSADSSQLLSGSGQGEVFVTDVEKKALVQTLQAHEGPVNVICFSKDGKYMLTGGDDKCANVFTFDKKWTFLRKLKHADKVTSAAFSPEDDLLVTGCADSIARIFRVGQEWDEVARVKGHSDEVNSVAFTGKGPRLLLATASDDKLAFVWDVSKVLITLKVAKARSSSAESTEKERVVGDPADMEGMD